MRLPSDEAHEIVAVALRAGITIFDTARAYGDNERLLAAAIQDHGAASRARIITKGGMTRPGGAWVPDGRAKSIRANCEASLASLGGLPIDLFLLHAPDPRTPWRTSLRALAALADEGLVRRVGVSNVNRRQLDEALELAPIAAVEVALSLVDDHAVREGIVDRCSERDVVVVAHSPLGGPNRIRALARSDPLAQIAAAHQASPAEVALAWLLGLSPTLIAIPGARRPEAARSCARAADLVLTGAEHRRLAHAFGHPVSDRPAPRPRGNGEVVLVMGIPGAGKTRVAAEYVAAGYLRLNRDERGGGLRGLVGALEEELAGGVRRVVLDNTYLTRATRSRVIETAARHGLRARCVWLDTPLDQAQVNLVERLLERVGTLPAPDEIRRLARQEPGVMAPTSQMRALRELEPPAADEGFARVEVVPFARTPPAASSAGGVLVAAAVTRHPGWPRALPPALAGAPHLVFDWHPEGSDAALQRCIAELTPLVGGPVQSALCPHPAGPPACWCRPPLPGLPLSFIRARGLDPAGCTLIGCRPTDRTLATTLGAGYVDVS
jgi:aryl-alcohol dehydrogenase-like predicted oxidoreductase/predicted kinase